MIEIFDFAAHSRGGSAATSFSSGTEMSISLRGMTATNVVDRTASIRFNSVSCQARTDLQGEKHAGLLGCAFQDQRPRSNTKKYTDLVPGIIANGGKVLARGGRFQIMEGPDKFHRFIVIEFPTLEQGVACFTSPEYDCAAGVPAAGAGEVETIMVDGI